MLIRKISTLLNSVPTIEGAGVHLKRAFGYHQVPKFDPFLMLDDLHTSNPDEYLAGFPLAPSSGDRNHHIYSGGSCRAWRQHGQQGCDRCR